MILRGTHVDVRHQPAEASSFPDLLDRVDILAENPLWLDERWQARLCISHRDLGSVLGRKATVHYQRTISLGGSVFGERVVLSRMYDTQDAIDSDDIR